MGRFKVSSLVEGHPGTRFSLRGQDLVRQRAQEMVPTGAQERAGSTRSPTADVPGKVLGTSSVTGAAVPTSSTLFTVVRSFSHSFPPAAPSKLWDCHHAYFWRAGNQDFMHARPSLRYPQSNIKLLACSINYWFITNKHKHPQQLWRHFHLVGQYGAPTRTEMNFWVPVVNFGAKE